MKIRIPVLCLLLAGCLLCTACDPAPSESLPFGYRLDVDETVDFFRYADLAEMMESEPVILVLETGQDVADRQPVTIGSVPGETHYTVVSCRVLDVIKTDAEHPVQEGDTVRLFERYGLREKTIDGKSETVLVRYGSMFYPILRDQPYLVIGTMVEGNGEETLSSAVYGVFNLTDRKPTTEERYAQTQTGPFASFKEQAADQPMLAELFDTHAIR